MPKTKFQTVIFTILMTFFMVYVMICYNIALNVGGMSNQVLLMAFHELLIMWPIAFIIDFFVVARMAEKLAFRMVRPDDKPIFVILAISATTVCLMCPIMSLVATILFKNAGTELVAVWMQTTVMNFPMAFCWQIFYCGPLVRFLFGKLFPEKKKNKVEEASVA